MKAVANNNKSRFKNHGSSSANATTTVAQSTSPPTTVELCGVSIHFPFKPYKCQEAYMTKVLEALHKKENALLESPTGTGKTLCLLCSTLAWQREQARLLRPDDKKACAAGSQTLLNNTTTETGTASPTRVPTIIYASRTHSQLSQVVRELRNTRYRPKHAVLGSRDQMCVHPKVKTSTSTATDVNYECSKLAKERTCRYRNRVEGFVPPTNDGSRSSPQTIQPVMDMEDLVAMGKEHKVCPFYFTRNQVAEAELIVVPYNYLFEKDARQGALAEAPWQNSVVIFDEAHNLEAFASESASFDLTNLDIAGCIHEVSRAMSYMQAMPEYADRMNPDHVTKIKAIFLQLEEYLLRMPSNNNNAYTGEYIFEIFGKGARINHANHHLFLQEVQKISDLIMEVRGGSSSSTSKGTPKLDHFCTCLKRVFGESTHARCLAKSRAYRVHLSSDTNGRSKPSSSRTLSYWCFAPSLAMHELADLGIRSILVTSGTLSPLPSYSMELGLSFPHQLENPHIIQDHQVHVRVIGKGVSGKLLSSTYERRDNADYILELGNSFVSLARIMPGGVLVFFPSYGVMEKCIAQWGGPSSSFQKSRSRNPFFQGRRRKSATQGRYSFPHAPNYYAAVSNEPQTPWKRLLALKAVVVEPKTTSELADAIAEFHKFLNKPKSTGCVLMGVCRGKISEGIDFMDDMCRAVVITGIPFAPYLDPKVKLKREYLDGVRAEKAIRATDAGGFGSVAPMSEGKANVKASSSTEETMSGAEWYSQQAHRAVNQAIGRVIRNKSDYGAVLLMDARFGEPRNQIGLSKWLRPHVQTDQGFGRAIGGLAAFYKKAKQIAGDQRKKENTPSIAPTSNTNRAVALEYEKDEQVDNYMTNIAIIQTYASENSKSGSEEKEQTNPGISSAGSATNAGEDGSLFGDYVEPNRVLARIDLKDQATKKKIQPSGADAPPHRSGEESSRSDPGPASLKDVYNTVESSTGARKKLDANGDTKIKSAWSGLGGQKRHNEHEKPSRIKIANEHSDAGPRGSSSMDKHAKASATEFFRKAKTELDSKEFAKARKVLVAMKAYGDKKDVQSYLRSAYQLIDILVRYDSYDGDNPGLLGLLTPLLPRAHQKDILRYASKRKYEESEFRCMCKEDLPPEDFDTVSSLVPKVANVHQPGVCPSPTKEYIANAQVVLEIIHKVDEKASRGKTEPLSLVDHLFKMIPATNANIFHALIQNLRASKNIQRIKKEEAYYMGEKAVETARFRRSQVPTNSTTKNKDKNTSESDPKRLEERREMEAALMQASELQGAKRARLEERRQKPRDQRLSLRNAYQSKKPRFATGNTEAISAFSRAKKQKAKTMETAVGKSTENSGRSHLPIKVDPVDKCLRQLEEDAYVNSEPRAAAEIARKIKSNVPKGFVCTVCDKQPKQPFMAPCHHHACLQCWLQWLKKSKTCPVCRSATDKECLAKMVFQTEPNAEAPTMTQLCASVEEAESSSEEELELVGTKE